jgi:hypothetical protein
VSKASRNRQAAKDKLAQIRAEQARRRRRRLWAGVTAGAVGVVAAAVGITLAVVHNGPKNSPVTTTAPLSSLGAMKPPPAAGALGPENVPVPAGVPLAGISAAATGQRVDGISCQNSEQTLFHIHAHLAVFVNGTQRSIPAAIGIPGAQAQNSARGSFIAGGTCFYWLHTHAADGIIHIESPVTRTYTLGNFFDEWGQPLSTDQVGPAVGHVTAIYNGKAYQGNPRDIPLTAHAQIQLEVGTPLVAPQPISFPAGL